MSVESVLRQLSEAQRVQSEKVLAHEMILQNLILTMARQTNQPRAFLDEAERKTLDAIPKTEDADSDRQILEKRLGELIGSSFAMTRNRL